MSRIHDITPPITEDLKVWPGDTPPLREILSEIDGGASVTLSTLHATVHLGAHADAPSHYGRGAPCIDSCSLDPYLGPCQVVHVDGQNGTRVARGSSLGQTCLPAAIRAPRVLFATGTYPDPTVLTEDFVALSPMLIEALAGSGVMLVGIDTPSVDPFTSIDLPAHRACLEHHIAILEGLRLSEVPDGVYELIALPLRLVGFDASPVRAILREMS